MQAGPSVQKLFTGCILILLPANSNSVGVLKRMPFSCIYLSHYHATSCHSDWENLNILVDMSSCVISVTKATLHEMQELILCYLPRLNFLVVCCHCGKRSNVKGPMPLSSRVWWWMKKQRDQFPSVLWHCLFGDRNGIRPIKNCATSCHWFSSGSNGGRKLRYPALPGKRLLKWSRQWW